MKKLFVLMTLISSQAVWAQVTNESSQIELDSDAEISEVIFGGQDVTPEEAAGLVTMRLEPQFKNSVFAGMGVSSCSGTLITRNVVLTAAHCVKAFEKIGDQIQMAVHYRALDGKMRKTEMKDFVIHEDYSGNVGPNDVALVRLKKTFTDRKPVRLMSESEFANGQQVLVLGYGDNDRKQISQAEMTQDPEVQRLVAEAKKLAANDVEKRNALVKALVERAAQLSAQNQPLLKSSMKATFMEIFGGRMVYLDGRGTAICQGDSGGPSYVVIDGRLKLAGVHSGGARTSCDAKVGGLQGFFKKDAQRFGLDVFVPSQAAWIQKQIQKWSSDTEL